jgi:hypothetical protein
VIFVGGFCVKQLVWELTHTHIKELREKAHAEASENLEQVGASSG